MPQTVREYFLETGLAGQDGKLVTATLYYNWNEQGHQNILSIGKQLSEKILVKVS